MKTQVIPKGQVKIIIEALTLYEKAIQGLDVGNNEVIAYKIFDMMQLKGLLKSKVKIELTDDEYENFTNRNGVDFPNYIAEKVTEKPTEEVTMIGSIVAVINFLNKEKVNYNLVDETDQIRIELFLNNSHDTKGDYIVITEKGSICMNLFNDLPMKNVMNYIKMYNEK